MSTLFDDDTDDLKAIRAEILKYRSTELMNDRERARFLGLPDTTRIRENAKILGPEQFVCGHHVWIGEGALLDAQGGLEIGDWSQIGPYVMIWSHSTHRQALAGETGVSKEKIRYERTRIGSHCFIAGHSVIAAGVTIGHHAIVAPMSFVDEDLPDHAVFSNSRRMRAMEDEIEKLRAALAQLQAGSAR